MAQDLLLTVGIDLSSLKTAHTQIATELKSWKFPDAEQVKAIDEKQLKTASKAAKDLSKEIIQISDAYKPENQEEQINLLGQQAEQSEKLAKSSALYKLQNDALGKSISLTRAELNTYLRAEASGIPLTEQEIAKKNELIATYNKQIAATKSLFHGIDPGRLILWGLGWQAVYGSLRLVMNGIKETIISIRDLNLSIAEMRIASRETSIAYDNDWNKIKDSIIDASAKSLTSMKQLSEATATLSFEGIKGTEALATATKVVADLMTVTKAKDNAEVTKAVAESYGLFKDKLIGATTEQEKMLKIGSLLFNLFTKGHVTIQEYNTMMSRVGMAAADALPNFETLVTYLQLMDMGMKGNRVGAMELAQVLLSLSANSAKLSDELGITFSAKNPQDFTSTLEALRKKFGETIDTTEAFQLKQIGLNDKSIIAFKFILQNYDLVQKEIENNANSSYEIVESYKKQVTELHPIQKIWQNIVSSIARATEFTARQKELNKKQVFDLTHPAQARASKEAITTLDEVAISGYKVVDSIYAINDATNLYIKTIKEFKEEDKDTYKAATELPFSIQKSIVLSEKQLNLRKLETLTTNEAVLSNERINIAMQTVALSSSDLVKQKQLMSKLDANREATELEIYNIITKEISGEAGIKAANEYILAIQKERAAVQIKMYEEIMSLSNEIESSTADFAKNLMSGTANVNDFTQSILDSYKETFATEITKIFGEKTGIFTNMAAAFMSPLQKAHYTGVQAAVPLIVQAHIDGIKNGMSTASIGNNASVKTDKFGTMTGFATGVAALFGSAQAKTQQDINKIENIVLGNAKTIKEQATSKLAQAGKLAGQALGAAGAVYGGYQGIMAQKGQGAGMGALGGALSGAMAGSMFGPVGMAIGGLIGGIAGGIMGGKKNKIPDEIKQSTIEIKSAISVSNKELQLVNRNLDGIKRAFEGFWMPRSAYFSERLGVEERFNLDRQRG